MINKIKQIIEAMKARIESKEDTNIDIAKERQEIMQKIVQAYKKQNLT